MSMTMFMAQSSSPPLRSSPAADSVQLPDESSSFSPSGNSQSSRPTRPRLSPLAASVGPSPSTRISPETGGTSFAGTSFPKAPSSLAASFSSRVGSPAGDDIEMKPVIGHRRRKSSLMSPTGHSGGAPGRPMPSPTHRRHLSVHVSDRSDLHEETDGASSGKEDGGRSSFSDDDLHDDEETGLTTKERARRQKRRRKNTQLGQRIAREKHLSPDEQKEADKNVARTLLINGLLILLWYLFSLSISLYNKWMFDEESLNFAFPLFTTSMHMVVQFTLSALVLYFVPSLRPQTSRTSDLGRSRHETEANNSIMTKMFYITRVGPCGAATGLDIGLGNTSLKFISLTFYTMCKSSSLAFVLIFAFMFRLETPTWRLVSIIAVMTMGVILMVFGEVEFKLSGFVLVISAAVFSGFRWSLTQILLLRNPATSNPFSSIFFLTPVMFVTLLSLAIPVEGFMAFWEGLLTLSAEWGLIMTPLFLLFPGCIAFLMTASEFALLQRTSVVTLSIAGIFKEVVTISAASIVFKDKLTFINFVGLVVTMVAIGAYNYIKITKMREDAHIDIHVTDVDGMMLSSNSNSASDMDNDEVAEETMGLLHQSIEMGQASVSADCHIQSNKRLSPVAHGADDHKESRSNHED